MQISITRALNELKLLDKRINSKIFSTQFIACAKKSSKKVTPSETKEEFSKNVKSNFTSIVDLIDRRNKIKTAIVASNAKTKIIVAENEMTVADAIERKNNGIEYEKILLNELRRQYNKYVAQYNTKNEKVEEEIYNLLITMVGKDNVNKEDERCKSIANTYRENNEWELINPLQLKQLIEREQKEIDDFENEIDFVLSESNAITKIEIPD